MAFLLRKLLSDYDEDEDSLDCSSVCADDSSKVCPSSCFSVCPRICYSQNLTTNLNPPPSSHQPFAKSHKFTLLLISLLLSVFIACLLAFLSVLYRRFYSRRFTSRARSSPRPPDSYDEFIDEEEGPILDHPIWYIRTVGLQQSVISAITICKYKRGDGLIEGTDCSVCLTEFEEEESLRLLPKCSHAFHLPCIDTWLQSHTSCPLCRAPVFTVAPSPEPGPVSFGQAGVIQLENSQNVGDLGNREEEGDEEEQEEEQEEEEEEEEGDELPLVEDRTKRSGENSKGGGGGVQMARRSVSLDSRSDFQISCALPRVYQDPKSGSDQIELPEEKELNTVEISSKRSGKNETLLSLVSASSSGKSVHRETVKRSLSCSSKFFLRSSSSRRKNGVIPK